MTGMVFLDRDGVLNEDSPEYITGPERFRFIPGSPEAVALLNRHGFGVIVVTNQSMIGRGLADQIALDAIFARMHEGLAAAGGRLLDVFFCPHHPDAGCDCRKPRPGLFFQARDRYGLDLSAAIMVGDSVRDIEAGRAAGCGRTALVATGNGVSARQRLAAAAAPPDYYGPDLMAVARWITA